MATIVLIGLRLGCWLTPGAAYSAIGMSELCELAHLLLPGWDGEREPKPQALEEFDYWQYGVGAHASDHRGIFGSVTLTATSSAGPLIHMLHAVLEGSSQRVIGWNVTASSIVDEAVTQSLRLVNPDGLQKPLPLIVDRLQIHIGQDVFDRKSRTLHASIAEPVSAQSWRKRKRIVHRVHRHVCGHAALFDMRTLLERNGLL